MKSLISTVFLITFAGYLLYSYTNKNQVISFLSDPIMDSFQQYKIKYKKNYESSEENLKYKIFKDNYNFISFENSKKKNYTLAQNEYMDLTNEEFMLIHSGFKKFTSKHSLQITNKVDTDSVDWRKKQAVSEVKNQGICGSCWAFSAIGAIEGLNAIKNQKLVEFSEQALVDCSDNGNQGCNGGQMDNAFEYIKNNGIPTETAYAYKGYAGECQKFSSDFKISGFTDVSQNDTMQLMNAISQQPVSVAIQAKSLIFQFYFGGIMDFNCGTELDHGVLAVGYGVNESGQEYYIVKNSWGNFWGEKGYFRLARNTKENGPGMCGIQMQASYPTL